LGVVDTSQIGVAGLIARSVSDEDRIIRLAVVKAEADRNIHVIRPLADQLRQLPSAGGSISLPLQPLTTRGLERYFEIACHELDFADVHELNAILECSSTVNFLLSKLPLGPLDACCAAGAAKTLAAACDAYIHMAEGLQRAVDELLDMGPPAPGVRVPRVFREVDTGE
jgi:hypothetical protein